jgi:hypothetical protein
VTILGPVQPVPDPQEELADIARLIGRLRPDWRDAEAFYTLRSEAIGRLRVLARAPAGRWPPPVSRPTVSVRIIERVRVVLLPRRLAKPPRRRLPKPPSSHPDQGRLW